MARDFENKILNITNHWGNIINHKERSHSSTIAIENTGSEYS